MPSDRSYSKRFLLGLQSIDAMPAALRRALLTLAGFDIDASAFVEAGVSFVAGRFSLGANGYINRGGLIDCRGGVAIGARTLLGPRITILTATHPIMAGYPRAGDVIFAPVSIGSDAWIGAGVTILPGVNIARGAVVAAGALVNKSLAGDAVYAGVPARKVRDLAAPAHGISDVA